MSNRIYEITKVLARGLAKQELVFYNAMLKAKEDALASKTIIVSVEMVPGEVRERVANSFKELYGKSYDLLVMDEATEEPISVPRKNEPWYRKQGKQRC